MNNDLRIDSLCGKVQCEGPAIEIRLGLTLRSKSYALQEHFERMNSIFHAKEIKDHISQGIQAKGYNGNITNFYRARHRSRHRNRPFVHQRQPEA